MYGEDIAIRLLDRGTSEGVTLAIGGAEGWMFEPIYRAVRDLKLRNHVRMLGRVNDHDLPALLTGFALAFARGVGEYGSVIFIAGNMPMISEITPLLIITKLEQYDYAGATAIATVMLALSFVLLLVINGLQAWQARRNGADGFRPGVVR